MMDAVEHGQSFTVTRDGHRIGELTPLRRLRRFVLRENSLPCPATLRMPISAITLAELSAGPHEVRRDDESEFDPVPFGTEAARMYGRVTAAVIAAGRTPRGRAMDLMIAATAIAERLPLYTTNPADFSGVDSLMTAIPVTRPPVPRKRRAGRAH